jgi:ADP-ribosylglycohydrolase
MRAYGSHGQPAGTWSDDTSMLLATLDSLLSGFDPADIMYRFSLWMFDAAYTPYEEVFDKGLTVHQALLRYRGGKAPLLCGSYGEKNNGNGSLMRILPACLYALTQVRRGRLDMAGAVHLVHEASALTHAHVVSKAGCGIYCFLVRALLEDGTADLLSRLQAGIDAAWAHYRAADWYNYEDALSRYDRLLGLNAFRALPEAMIDSSGYVVATLEAALWCLLNTDSLEAALLRAVNLGRDTDTVACVAGGLAGLFYGEDAIPADWLSVLAWRHWIMGLCDKAAAVW